MKISVIIPTFNRKNFLKEALLSVFNQTFKNFEVIVYDDGSTDNTYGLIRQMQQYYPINYIYSKENKGPSYARNRAVKAANGRYIAFLDSDDLWLKNKLKIQYQFLIENQISICQTDEYWIRNGKKVNPMNKHKKPSGDVFERSLDLCVVSPSAVMLEKKLFEEIGGFDERMPACEDYDLWLRISLKEHIYLINKKLVIKRGGHYDQLSQNIPYLDRYRIYCLKKLLDTNCVSEVKKRLITKKLQEKCYIMIKGLKKKLKYEEAKVYENILERYTT